MTGAAGTGGAAAAGSVENGDATTPAGTSGATGAARVPLVGFTSPAGAAMGVAAASSSTPSGTRTTPLPATTPSHSSMPAGAATVAGPSAVVGRIVSDATRSRILPDHPIGSTHDRRRTGPAPVTTAPM